MQENEQYSKPWLGLNAGLETKKRLINGNNKKYFGIKFFKFVYDEICCKSSRKEIARLMRTNPRSIDKKKLKKKLNAV